MSGFRRPRNAGGRGCDMGRHEMDSSRLARSDRHKGVITGDDARQALDTGSSGVIVSNHGGRQLDTCYPTLRALPEVIRAVDGRAPVIVDGGIRRGGDIIKALCMGAQAVLIGRAYAYGLAAEGRAGVAHAISILKADLERTMALLGCASLNDLNPSFVS